MRFVTKTIHAWLDYPVAVALIGRADRILGLGVAPATARTAGRGNGRQRLDLELELEAVLGWRVVGPAHSPSSSL